MNTLGLRVWGLGFRDYGSGFRVQLFTGGHVGSFPPSVTVLAVLTGVLLVIAPLTDFANCY